ncbi:MAG: L,D-transpeptidase [Pseudomonadota bacterium]
MRGILKFALCLPAVVAAAVSYPQDSANAQFFWGASGRSVVGFPKSYGAGQIIVSFRDRRLYHVTRRGRAVSYPIAVPKPSARWSGALRVSMKRVNPPWTPTPKMRRQKPWLPATVPGGHPKNPMGNRALYLGSTLYRIHGTDAPWTIGKNVSQGCIRMHNSHVAELYSRVRIGTRVVATYKSYAGRSYAYAGVSSSSSASTGGDDWQRRLTRGL